MQSLPASGQFHPPPSLLPKPLERPQLWALSHGATTLTLSLLSLQDRPCVSGSLRSTSSCRRGRRLACAAPSAAALPWAPVGSGTKNRSPPLHLASKTPERLGVTTEKAPSSSLVGPSEQIVDGPEVWVETTDVSSTLVITEATARHAGRYTLVVRDRRSSAQHTLTLSVVGKKGHAAVGGTIQSDGCSSTVTPTERPQPPASCPAISPVSATSLALSWSGPCYDGGSAVLGYVVEIKTPAGADSAAWRKLTHRCASTSYVVSELQAQQEYCFRVSAYNAVGISPPGPVSPPVRMERKGEPMGTLTHKQMVDKQAFVTAIARVFFFF